MEELDGTVFFGPGSGSMRCYNGCPDSALRRRWDAEDEARARLQKVYPGARCAFFPTEGKFQVFSGGKLVGGMHYSNVDAIDAFFRIMEVRQ